MEKPKTCLDRPAMRFHKNTIYCACKRILKAELKDLNEQEIMWQNCPLCWNNKKV